MSYPYLIQGNNIVITIGMKPHTITKSHLAYEKVKEAIVNGDWAALPDLVEPKQVVLKYGNGNVSIDGETLKWRGKVMHNALATKMIGMLKEGFPIDPLVKFMDRLMQNPSKRAVEELYLFLEKGQLPITPDGHFLAYKKVRADYMDVHSGTVLNKPYDLMTREDMIKVSESQGKKGEVTVDITKGITTVSMPRNQVDDNRDNTCSEGLHFCSLDYLKNFGGERIVVLSIDPADVVSIPSDYNNTKGRTAKYQVVGELTVEAPKAFTSSVQTTANTETRSGVWKPVAMVAKAKPVVKAGPKTGDSAFYRGYSDGYAGVRYNPPLNGQNYDEGYTKGWDDRSVGVSARYQYVGDDQEYDANGRALSMTKDAIRKRKARAAAKAAKQAAPVRSMPVQPKTVTPTAWPFPHRK